MKKILICFLSFFVICSSPLSFAREEITQLQEETDRLYRHDVGGGDGAYTALGSSMLGWGVGLAVLVTVVTLVLHNSPSQ